MKRTALSLVVAVGILGLALGGCFEHEVKLQVARDGSGTIKETTYFSPQVLAMLAGMQGAMQEGMGEDGEAAPAPADPNAPNPLIQQMMNRDELEAKASEYGEGVKLKDAQPVKLADGRQGVEAVYAFKDISKVRIPLDPEQPGGDMEFPGPGLGAEEMPEEAEEPEEEEREYAKMMFTKGVGDAPARLTVLLPQEEDEDDSAPEPEMTPEEKAMQMAGMQMMSGLRWRILVVPQGQITKTNATFVDKKTNTVTLLDLNFDEMLKNEKLMQEMMAGGGEMPVGELRKKMKAKDPQLTKAIKFEPAEKVLIEFK